MLSVGVMIYRGSRSVTVGGRVNYKAAISNGCLVSEVVVVSVSVMNGKEGRSKIRQMWGTEAFKDDERTGCERVVG